MSGRHVQDPEEGAREAEATRTAVLIKGLGWRLLQRPEILEHPKVLAALRKFPTTDNAIVEKLSEYTGIDKTTLLAWSLDIAAYDSRGNSLFLTTLLKSKGLALGEYDGRVTAIETGIAGKIDPNSGGNDPTMTAVSGVYTTMWNVYLN